MAGYASVLPIVVRSRCAGDINCESMGMGCRPSDTARKYYFYIHLDNAWLIHSPIGAFVSTVQKIPSRISMALESVACLGYFSYLFSVAYCEFNRSADIKSAYRYGKRVARNEMDVANIFMRRDAVCDYFLGSDYW